MSTSGGPANKGSTIPDTADADSKTAARGNSKASIKRKAEGAVGDNYHDDEGERHRNDESASQLSTTDNLEVLFYAIRPGSVIDRPVIFFGLKEFNWFSELVKEKAGSRASLLTYQTFDKLADALNYIDECEKSNYNTGKSRKIARRKRDKAEAPRQALQPSTGRGNNDSTDTSSSKGLCAQDQQQGMATELMTRQQQAIIDQTAETLTRLQQSNPHPLSTQNNSPLTSPNMTAGMAPPDHRIANNARSYHRLANNAQSYHCCTFHGWSHRNPW